VPSIRESAWGVVMVADMALIQDEAVKGRKFVQEVEFALVLKEGNCL